MRIHGQSAAVVKEIIAVQDLKLGMFIAELDRPWLGTPFAIQGFLATDAEELTQLRGLCRFVYVDRSRSIGEHWAEPERERPQARRRATPPRQSVVTTTAAQRRPTSSRSYVRSAVGLCRGLRPLAPRALRRAMISSPDPPGPCVPRHRRRAVPPNCMRRAQTAKTPIRSS